MKKEYLVYGSIALIIVGGFVYFGGRINKRKNLATENGFPFSINPSIMVFDKTYGRDNTTIPNYEIFRDISDDGSELRYYVFEKDKRSKNAVYDRNGIFIAFENRVSSDYNENLPI